MQNLRRKGPFALITFDEAAEVVIPMRPVSNKPAVLDRIDRIQSPFKLMDKRSDLASHRITIGGVTLGEELFVIAGACTIDPKNPNYFYETAAAVKDEA